MEASLVLAFDSPSEESFNLDDELYLPYFLGDCSPPPMSWDLTDWQLVIGEKQIDRSIDAACPDTAPKTPRKRAAPRKRKSVGQALPEPTTNLPPRKRARTEEEKEQRRIERVLRNRRAAHCSRERRRLEVEALEAYNKTLELRLVDVIKANSVMVTELKRLRHTGDRWAWSPCADEPTISLNNRATGPQRHCETSPSQSTAVSYATGNYTELTHNVSCPTVDLASVFSDPPAFGSAAELAEVIDPPTQPGDVQSRTPEAEKPPDEYGGAALALGIPSTVYNCLRLDSHNDVSSLGNDFWPCAATAAGFSEWEVTTSAPGNALGANIYDAACNPYSRSLLANDELVAEATEVVTDILLSRCNEADHALEPETQCHPPDRVDPTAQAVLLLTDV